jgi:hypothetical protein
MGRIGFLAALVAAGCEPAPPSAETCASGEAWTGGDEESPLMHPGMDCIACHAQEGEGPSFTVAGTVMADPAEPDDCFGVEGVTVRITGADDAVHEAVTNAAGNFSLTEAIAFPYTVTLERDGATRGMLTPQSEGACGSCHTETGENAAPGRVLAPE